MSPGLRERNRLRAMQSVQNAALDLFDRHGFDEVTVAAIADHAEVAERSVYRYFGTKEGILLWNEADVDFVSSVSEQLPSLGLRGALRATVEDLDVTFTDEQREHSARLVALIDRVPSVRAQVAVAIATAGEELGSAVAVARGLPADDLDCRIEASSAITALSLALQAWESTQSDRPLSGALLGALDALDNWGG